MKFKTLKARGRKAAGEKNTPENDGVFIQTDGIQNNTVRYGEEQDVDDL